MFSPVIPPVIPKYGVLPELGGYCYDVAIAHCADTDRDLIVRTSLLNAVYDGGMPFHELTFEIGVLSKNGEDDPFFTMDRDIAARYIPPEIHGEIMDIVCHCVGLLVESERPQRVYRVTKTRSTPVKGLAKHQRITDILEQLGYKIGDQGNDDLDRHYWDMFT